MCRLILLWVIVGFCVFFFRFIIMVSLIFGLRMVVMCGFGMIVIGIIIVWRCLFIMIC